MVIAKNLPEGIIYTSGSAEFCKEVSTKSNNEPVAESGFRPQRALTGVRAQAAYLAGRQLADGCAHRQANRDQAREYTLKGRTLSPHAGFLTRLKLELAYFSCLARVHRRGIGVILRFERVRPRRGGRFQPLRSREITPEFLDRTIRALKRWQYDIVSMDEVCRRAVTLAEGRRRFVCLTFDGGHKDVISSAFPVLSRHAVPFTVYVSTAFPDGIGEAWWLALEQVIGREARISLVMDRKERRFDIPGPAEKYQLYDFLSQWMRSLSPSDLSAAIKDLCRRYTVDLAALSREASLDWNDLAKLAANPLVTVGSATVNYPVLSNLKDAVALREMAMGRAVAQAALGDDVTHLAYPFGDPASWCHRHAVMAREAGFVSAVSAIPGVVEAEGRTDPYALPRVTWDGRRRSLRAMRALLSGVTLSPGRSNPSADAHSSGRDIQLTIGIAGSTHPIPATT